MGITKYTSNLISTFPKICFRKTPDIHTVCIDVNSILHPVCMKSTNKLSFQTQLINRLNKLINKTKPQKIALFTDGQAVLAKAQTQIKRRKEHLYKQESDKISTLNLTPGTPFLDFIDDVLKKYLKSLNIPSYYSPSTEPNEGELKLFEWLQNNLQNKDEKVCVIGNDADIIVLALANTPLLNLYIYNNFKFISLFKLVQELSKYSSLKFNYKYHPVRKDFALLAMLQGNDYVTKVSNYDNLLSAYEKLQNKSTCSFHEANTILHNREKPNYFLIRKNGELNLPNIKKLLLFVYTIDNVICSTKEDVVKYLECLKWNFDLYSGKVNNNYIPSYNNINISSLIKYMPHKLSYKHEKTKWLDNKTYLLLLIPSVGKHIIPEHLQCFMEKDSPIYDLFPDPCPECIQWKEKIRNLIIPDNNCSEEKEEFKKISRETNLKYNLHLKQFHPINDLPIKRIENCLNLSNQID